MTLFTLPTSRRITQDWGQDFQWLNGTYYPNGFYSSIGWLGHNGIDYGCPLNDPVESVCDGVVEYVGPGNNHPLLSGGGNVVLIRNDEMQMRFEYLHLNQQNVYTGQRVTRGQVIAQSGNTGTSTAPHLHLGAIPVRPNLSNGYRGRVDPTGWLYGPSNPDYAAGAAIGPQSTITEVKEWYDMAIPQEDLDRIANAVLIGLNIKSKPVVDINGDSADMSVMEALQTVAFNTSPIVRDGRKITFRQETADIKDALLGQQGLIAGLTNAVQQLAAHPGSPVDLQAVTDAAEAGSLKALGDFKAVTTTTLSK